MNRGKLLILFIFGVSLTAAFFAWRHQYLQGRRSLAYWGSAGAMAIRTAPEVTLLKLAPPDTSAASDGGEKTQKIEGLVYLIVEQADLSQAPGLVHARQALITDVAFDWEARETEPNERFEYLLRFASEQQTVEMAINLRTRQARMIGQTDDVRLGERLAGGLATFFAEHLASEPAD